MSGGSRHGMCLLYFFENGCLSVIQMIYGD